MIRPVVVLSWCLAATSPLMAAVNPEFEVPEVASSPGTEVVSASESPLPDGFATKIEFAFGVQTMSTDDLDDTYGLLPGGSIGLSWPVSRHTRFSLAAGYFESTGDLYYDMPLFVTDRRAHLRMVPITFSLRENLTPGSRTGIVGGLAAQIAWIEEDLPAGTAVYGYDDCSGYGFGLLVSLGPRWSSRDERRALGLELAIGGCGARIGEGRGARDIDLTGLHLRAYWSMQLGENPPVEVRR